MAGIWDKPDLKLEDLTKEQLIAHCKREARWHLVNGRSTDDELRKKIEKLERDLYNQGYILDKIHPGLTTYGGLDPKLGSLDNPREWVNCFWSITHKLRQAQEELAELGGRPDHELNPSSEGYDPIGGGGGSGRSDLPYGMGGGGD